MPAGIEAASLFAVIGAEIEEFEAKVADVDRQIDQLATGDAAMVRVDADLTAFEGATENLEKGLEDVSDAVEDTADDFEKGLEDVDDAINESAGGMRNSIGGALGDISGKFEGLRSRMTKKIVMGLAIAGISMAIDEIQARWTQLQDTFALATQPPSISKDLAIVNEAIKQQESAFLKWPGALDDLYKRRSELLGLEVESAELARTTAGFLESHVERENAAAEQLVAAVDVWASGMSGAVAPITSASGEIAGAVDAVGTASDRTRLDFESDFDSMLQTLVDMKEPVGAAAKAYAKALKDPIDIDERIAELLAEIERVAPDLESEAPNVRASAALYTKAMEDEIILLRDSMYGYGAGTADAWGAGLVGALHRQVGNISIALDEARGLFGPTSSPPPATSPLHEIDKWGYDTGEAWGLSMAKGARAARQAVADSVVDMSTEFDPSNVSVGTGTVGNATIDDALLKSLGIPLTDAPLRRPGSAGAGDRSGDRSGGSTQVNIDVEINFRSGIVTPDVADEIAARVGPALKRWVGQQRTDLVAATSDVDHTHV